MEITKNIADSVIAGNIDEVVNLTRKAVEQKTVLPKIMEEGFVAGLNMIGERYSAGEIFLPEMLVAGMAVAAGMEVLKPRFTQSEAKPKGTIVAGTVTGDMHDIGKNIVCMMSEGNGFKIIDFHLRA